MSIFCTEFVFGLTFHPKCYANVATTTYKHNIQQTLERFLGNTVTISCPQQLPTRQKSTLSHTTRKI